jgi:hypothetical protein
MEYRKKRGVCECKYLSDLLSQYLRLDYHALAVCDFPQRAAEDAGVDFLKPDTDTHVLHALSEEELVAEEGLDDGGYASPETGSRSTRAAVVHGCVHLLEQPVVRCLLDLEDLYWKRHLRFRRVLRLQAIRPPLGKHTSYVCLEHGVYDSLGESSRIVNDDGAKANIHQLLAVRTRFLDESR